MSKRIFVLLASMVLIGCKKDEPAPPPKVAVETPQPKQETPKEVKKDPPKSDPRIKLTTLDLRSYGIFAAIDAPARAAVKPKPEGGDLAITGADGYELSIKAGASDLAREYEEIKSSDGALVKSKPVDEPDAFIVELEQDGMKRYHLFVNVSVEGKPYTLFARNSMVSPAQAKRNVEAARTLRQTPEIRMALERRGEAIRRLSRDKEAFAPLKSGEYSARVSSANDDFLNDMKAVLAVPEIAELELVNTAQCTDEHIQMLSDMPNLRTLRLTGKWVSRRIVSALPALERLERLYIADAPVDDSWLRPIASLTRLKRLSLANSRVADSAPKILSELKELEYLELHNTNLTSAGLVHFKAFPKLQQLLLNDTAVGDANLSELAAAPALQHLHLVMTSVSDKGLEAFAKVDRPLTLVLYATDVTLEGIAKLKKANDKITIDTAWLEEPEPKPVAPPVAVDKLPPADVAGLVAKFNGKLTREDNDANKPIIGIDLGGSKVTDTDLGHLRAATKLQRLDLANCTEITDAGLPYLAGLMDLEELNLRGTRVKGDGLAHLKDLKDLVRLYLPLETVFTGRQLAPIVALPGLEVLSFKLPGQNGFLQLRALAKATELKGIDFTDVSLTNRHLDYLKNWKRLETIVLSSTERLSDRALANLKGLEKLKVLKIPAFSGTNFGLEALRGLSNLKYLELFGANITDGGMTYVGSLGGLEHLRLDRLNIGDDGARSLRNYEHLRELSLDGTRVTDKGLDAIADNKAIEFVDLSHTKITDAGLAKFENLEELRGLRLDGTAISGKGVEALARTPRFFRISVQDARVDDTGAAAIARVSRLRIINLSGNDISNAAVGAFKNLRELDELSLDRCAKLTDEVVATLKTFPALKRVSLKGTKLSAKAIDDLRKSGVQVDADVKP
jgi:Leucine-rich repeat (LRR) protein